MWNLEKIESLINSGIEENIRLDYKAANSLGKSDGKKSEISKDVSAFANSAGGTIIYGVSEFNEPTKKHLPEKVNAVDRLEFSKEWLEQIINSNITPKINGVEIYPITIGNDSDNKVVYVVEIPQSNTAHQAKDKRYYKRYNFESVAMEDYEIKDIINRTNTTDIEIEFLNFHGKEWFKKYAESDDVNIKTEIWAYNRGNKIAQNLQVFISGTKESSYFIIEPNVENHKDYQLLFSNEEERKLTINDNDFIIGTDRFAILPRTRRKIGDITFKSNLIKDNHEIELLICTEDRSKLINLKGQEIVDGK
ncbi:ATP-binding protein [Chryseobacterium sp. NEB161]|nr:ATP-binding protein [Chryseobacterium sp. NEB161]